MYFCTAVSNDLWMSNINSGTVASQIAMFPDILTHLHIWFGPPTWILWTNQHTDQRPAQKQALPRSHAEVNLLIRVVDSQTALCSELQCVQYALHTGLKSKYTCGEGKALAWCVVCQIWIHLLLWFQLCWKYVQCVSLIKTFCKYTLWTISVWIFNTWLLHVLNIFLWTGLLLILWLQSWTICDPVCVWKIGQIWAVTTSSVEVGAWVSGTGKIAHKLAGQCKFW